MAKKSKKGEKMDLGTFLGPDYGNALPTSSSGLPSGGDDRRFDRRSQYGEDSGGAEGWRRGPPSGGDRGGFEREDRGGRRRYDNDSSFSRGGGGGGDEEGTGEWRRGPRGGAGGEPIPRSAADEDNEWRKSRPPMRDDGPPPRSAADDDSEWRKSRPQQTRPEPPRSMADDASEWRRRQPMHQEAPPAQASIADEASEWRRKESVRPLGGEVTPPTPAAADADTNWRKNLQAPRADEPVAQTPKTESMDWRSNKAQPPPSRDERPRQADAVDNWRTAPKPKKTSAGPGSSGSKREYIPLNAEVLTPKGKGILIEHRASDNTRVVKLESGEETSVRAEDVLPALPREVSTAYGKGLFENYRFEDEICEVKLEFGATAYIRAGDLLPGNKTTAQHGKEGGRSRGGDKPSSTGTRSRRFGDQERDREREKAFGTSGDRRRGGNNNEEGTETRPGKGDLFASFGKDKGARAERNKDNAPPTVGSNGPPTVGSVASNESPAPPPSVGSAVPPPSIEERDRVFAAFNSQKGPRESREPRMSRDEMEKVFSGFNQGSKRGPDRDRPQQPRGDRVPFPFSDRPERTSFPGGDRQTPPQRGEDRPPFPGFERRGGGGGERGGDLRRGSPGPSAGGVRDEYMGGMERLNAGRQQNRGGEPPSVGRFSPAPARQEEFPALGSAAAKSTAAAPTSAQEAIPKTLPKGSKWGEADDEVPVQQQSVAPKKKAAAESAPVAPVKKIPLELAASSIRSIVKDFMIGEDKSTAIAALKQISTEDDKEFLTQFVATLCPEAFAGTKPKKLVASLLVEMATTKSMLTSEMIAEGITRALETAGSNDGEKVAALKDIFSTLREKNADLGEIKLRDAGVQLRDSEKSTGTAGEKDVNALAAEIFAAPDALAKLKEVSFEKLPGAGLALVKAVLKDAKLDDPSCPWIKKNAKVLSHVLFNAPKKEQLQALEAIQVAFNAAGFPKSSSGAVIDLAFTQLYNLDILPDSAFIAWKDDLSLNAPGRNTAIIQTTKFFTDLEAEEYEDEEDEE